VSSIRFIDGIKDFELNLDGDIQSIDELSQTSSNLILTSGGGRYKRGDPTFSEFEQETWEGGYGGEFYYDDNTKFRDASGINTRFPKKAFLHSLWKISDGLGRTQDKHMPGSVTWKALWGNTRAIAVQPANATYGYGSLLVRKRGTPGTLTYEVRANSSSLPNGAVAQTVTKTSTDFADILDYFMDFDWTGTQAFSSHWIVIYGAATDNDKSHYEIGVDEDSTGGYYIDDPSDTSWTTASFKPYYRVSDADTNVKWHMFIIDETEMYALSQPTSGNSIIRKWDETNDDWDTITVTNDAFSGQALSVAAVNNHAFITWGSTGNVITVFDNNAGTYRNRNDANAGSDTKAEWIKAITVPHVTNASQLIWAINDAAAGDTFVVKRAPVIAYGANLAVADTWQFPKGLDIIGLAHHDNRIAVRTRDGLYGIAYDADFADEIIIDVDKGLSDIVETEAFHPMHSDGQFLFYAKGATLMIRSKDAVKDVGLWKGVGLPDGRQGVISAICQGHDGVYVAVNAKGTGTSSVWFFDTNRMAYHEEWRAWKSGLRIRNIFYQPQVEATSPARLWINAGNDLIYIDQPDNSPNPLHDADTRYVWSGYITSTRHDFGAFQSKKIFEAVDLITQNLGQATNIELDFQSGKDVGTTTWYTVPAKALTNPIAHIPIGVEDENELVYRLRFYTTDNDTTPLLNAAVMIGTGTRITKRQWNLQFKLGEQTSQNTIAIYDWLIDAARSARKVTMQSDMLQMDNIKVKIRDGIRFFPRGYNKATKQLRAIVQVSVLEVEAKDDLTY
jgi:hypothetical protein